MRVLWKGSMPSKSARSAGRAQTQVPRCTQGLTVSLLRQTIVFLATTCQRTKFRGLTMCLTKARRDLRLSAVHLFQLTSEDASDRSILGVCTSFAVLLLV